MDEFLKYHLIMGQQPKGINISDIISLRMMSEMLPQRGVAGAAPAAAGPSVNTVPAGTVVDGVTLASGQMAISGGLLFRAN